MENVRQRGKQGTYYVVQNIPGPARSAFGGKAQVWISLRTTVRSEARSTAVQILADLEAKIATAMAATKAMNPPSIVSAVSVPINRPHAITALERWRRMTIDADYHATINGLDARARSLTGLERAALQKNEFGAVAGFRPLMVEALASQGIVADIDHPALDFLAHPFATAILSVENWRERFSLRLIDGWPEEEELSEAKSVAQPVAKTGMTISQLRDAWGAMKPLEAKQKGYIRRLIEFLGDVDISTIQPLDLDRFTVELRRFPLSKRPEDDKLSFAALIAKYPDPDQKRLSDKTVYLWTTVFKAMFEFAVSRQLISRNPASATVRKPSAEASNERIAFDDADLKVMFESPMYRGHSGRIDGNRDKPGEVITRDDRYWLPVVAVATGMRLEELASLKRSEVIREGDIVAFDLRDRPLTGINRLKNRMSKRLIPVSATLEATGFVEWADAGEGEYVFAGLEPDGKGKRGTKFGKWFARWTEANAPVKGQGIDDPDKPFHSMRHTFKRLARQSPVKEEISDLITGHTYGNAVARAYGRGVDLATLKAAIDQIEIAPLKAIRP